MTLAGTALLTALLAPFRSDVGLLNEGLLFLLFTLLVSSTWGRRVGLLAAVLTNVALNFFFIEPLFRFAVEDERNIVGLAIFLLVSVIGSSLLATAREAAGQAQRRQAQTEVLLGLSRAMIGQTDPQAALGALCREVVAAFDAGGAAVLSRRDSEWRVLAHAGSESSGRPAEGDERFLADRAVAEGSFQGIGPTGLSGRRPPRVIRPRSSPPGRGGETSVALAPLKLAQETLGLLRLDGPVGPTPFRDRPQELLVAFAGEAALAVQRVELAGAAARAEALKGADEMKTALMTSISHDLKTPLAAIKTSVSSLLDGAVSWSEEDKQAFLDTIDTQADRLNRLISDVLDLNRIESGTVMPALTPVAVRDLFGEAVERAGMAAAGRDIEVDAPSDVIVSCDASLLVQALVNLIENAAKYSKAGGAIRLEVRKEGGSAALAVEDQGPGIPPDELPYVFERFYRGSGRPAGVKGSGLGLAIVKAFVGLSGGTVEVDSDENGSCFIIRLPLATGIPVSA